MKKATSILAMASAIALSAGGLGGFYGMRQFPKKIKGVRTDSKQSQAEVIAKAEEKRARKAKARAGLAKIQAKRGEQ